MLIFLKSWCRLDFTGMFYFQSGCGTARPMINVPLLQIDRPMMDLAVNQGKRIGLLATVPTTIPASERLLYTAAAEKWEGD